MRLAGTPLKVLIYIIGTNQLKVRTKVRTPIPEFATFKVTRSVFFLALLLHIGVCSAQMHLTAYDTQGADGALPLPPLLPNYYSTRAD